MSKYDTPEVKEVIKLFEIWTKVVQNRSLNNDLKQIMVEKANELDNRIYSSYEEFIYCGIQKEGFENAKLQIEGDILLHV
jgi:hypothetical protein